jgi:hypothetical protein
MFWTDCGGSGSGGSSAGTPGACGGWLPRGGSWRPRRSGAPAGREEPSPPGRSSAHHLEQALDDLRIATERSWLVDGRRG